MLHVSLLLKVTQNKVIVILHICCKNFTSLIGAEYVAIYHISLQLAPTFINYPIVILLFQNYQSYFCPTSL